MNFPKTPNIFIIFIIYFLLFISIVKTSQFSSFGSLVSAHSTSVVGVVIAPYNAFIATGASQVTLKIWNYTSLSLITSHTYASVVTCVNVNSADLRIYVGLNDGTVSILNGTTFLQITNYAYPNAGKAYVFSLPKYQDQFYTGGNDVTSPIIHKFNGTDYTEINTGLTTTFSSGTQITTMDCYFNLLQNTLAVGSSQNSAPFRMIVYNVNTQIAENYDQATGVITFTKFCFQGQLLFTASADNKVRMYKYNPNYQKYSFKGLFNTISYGVPNSITCQTQEYVNIAAGLSILMLKVKEESLQLVDYFEASSSNINCIFQSNGMIIFGCVDGSVGLVTVNYPIIKKNMSPVIISGSILSGIVFLSLAIALYNLIKGQNLQQQFSNEGNSVKSSSDQQINKKQKQSQQFQTQAKIQEKNESLQVINVKETQVLRISSEQMKLTKQ